MENRHCWCTHLDLHARLHSSRVNYCLFPLEVVISESLAHAGFFRRHLLLRFKKVLCIFFLYCHLVLHLLVRSVAQRLLSCKESRQGSVKIPTHLFSFDILQPRRKRKKRMMT